MNKIKLDLKDRKILALLDENSRYTNSQIAKKVQLSKPAVEYRIQRLIKQEVIFQFYTVINFTKLGYSQYKLYLKFQNTSLEEEQKIIEYWKKDKNCIWVVQVRGRFDLSVSIFTKNNFEFGRILNSFMNKFSKFILEKDVLLTEYSPIYSRKHLPHSQHLGKEFLYGIPEKIYELDDEDIKILKEISTNARISIVELAEKINLSRDIINYHLKKLVKENIIIQYRCELNLEKIGINFYKLILRTKNFSEQDEKKLRDYLINHEKATQFLKLIGSWDAEIELETEGEDELYRILTDIRKNFSDMIRDFDILRITKTYKYTYFPF